MSGPMDPDEISDEHDRDYVTSLARGLEVIAAFTRNRPKMTLSDIARETGMTRATVRRFLLTLVREGYVDKDDKLFSLRPKVLELGTAALSSMGIQDVAQPVMNELAQELRESVFAAVLTGDHVTYIAHAISDRLVAVRMTVGGRTPAYAVSTGRVLLAAEPDDVVERYLERVKLEKLTAYTISSKDALRAELANVRQQGFSQVDQELEVGLGSISVPIHDRSGRVLAALNVCCPTSRGKVSEMQKKFLPRMLAASKDITNGLKSDGR